VSQQLRPLPYPNPPRVLEPRKTDIRAGYQALMPAGVRMMLRRHGARGMLASEMAHDTASDLAALQRTLLYMLERNGEVAEIEPGRWMLVEPVAR
jgi:hypothetical protein